MEYSNLYCVLQKELSYLPEAIVSTLIFRYTVNVNKYKYKYTLSLAGGVHSVRFNKLLNIMCVEFNDRYELIDYKTGNSHNNTIIDCNVFTPHMINITQNLASGLLYFSDNNIVMTNVSGNLFKYSLFNKIYNLSCRNNEMHTMPNNIIVHNEYIYILSRQTPYYWLNAYDLITLKHIRTSDKWEHYGYLLMSIFDETIYLCEYDSDKITYVYTHDTTNLKKSHEYECNIPFICSTSTLYKNKLYDYKSNQIRVYDLMTSENIYCIDVNTDYEEYMLSVSDDIILLHNGVHVIIYEIKQLTKDISI